LAGGRSETEQRRWQWTHDWIALRQNYPAIRNGRLTDLFYDDDVYAYARYNNAQTLVIVINRSSAERKLSLPAVDLAGNTRLTAVLGRGETSTVRSGSIDLRVPAGTAVAYLATKTGEYPR
jgi:hypothetical protein